MKTEILIPSKNKRSKTQKLPLYRTLGPVADLEKHLPEDWWKKLFNSLYLKTDGDVVENVTNTEREVDELIAVTGIQRGDAILDLCCGQGRHSIELARRGYSHVQGIDRSRYLVRLARKRAKSLDFKISFAEGDARKVRLPTSSQDCVILMGNSFGYFEREEDDLSVLKSIKNVLKSQGKLFLDIVDGSWMRNNYEPRSWEWIDQNHFVCRERSISNDSRRIISREVIVNADVGIIADQFYAERLYTFEEIEDVLKKLGFSNIILHKNVQADSTRGQDLGMMANRLFISAVAPEKDPIICRKQDVLDVKVLLGDHRQSDTIKQNGVFNEEDLQTIDLLKKALKKLTNYNFTYLDNHKTLIQDLVKENPRFILNLCDEGFNNQALLELHIPALLDMLGSQYTGSQPACLATCYNKSLVRTVANELEIHVPLETYYDPSDQMATLPSILPALLKPNYGDGSIGITQDAVVDTPETFISYLDMLRAQFPHTPILIQEFLPGAEYSVGLIGNPNRFDVLPILEVDYSQLPTALPRLLPYESKWVPTSPYWDKISYKEAVLDDDLARYLTTSSMKLFERLGCRDYARFDFRTDAEGIIKLLEVNPNPGWCWDGKLNLMAGFKGLEYSELLGMILTAARDRINGNLSL